MAYFAEIDEAGIVQQVIAVNDNESPDPSPDNEARGQAFIRDVLKLSGVWKQTSYNKNFRKRYAGIGFFYDSERDEFVPPDWQLVDNEWTAPPDPAIDSG